MGISCGSHRIWVRNVARTSGSSRVNRGSKQIMAGKRLKRTTPTVCIVESLDFLQEDSLKEGEIISRTLRLSEKPAHYTYLRSSDEMKAFVRSSGGRSIDIFTCRATVTQALFSPPRAGCRLWISLKCWRRMSTTGGCSCRLARQPKASSLSHFYRTASAG